VERRRSGVAVGGLPRLVSGDGVRPSGDPHAEQMFGALLESAPDAMVIVGDTGTIRLVNAQTEALFGYPREELLGRPVEVLVPDRFRGGHWVHRREHVANQQVRPMGAGLDLFGLRRDGSEFPVEISLSPLDTGDGLLVSAAVRDVSDRKAAEERINELVGACTIARDISEHKRAKQEITRLFTDDDPQRPQLAPPDSLAESGRGLTVVEALATAWGTWPSIAGKTVWFTLATDSPARISSRPPDGRPSR
jgi:PAS domain S-box-containing protein